MTMFAICITIAIACISASSAFLVWAAIKSSAPDPYCDRDPEGLARQWADIAEDFTADEFELLRRADRMMAGIEDQVMREWQDKQAKRRSEPYNWQERGL